MAFSSLPTTAAIVRRLRRRRQRIAAHVAMHLVTCSHYHCSQYLTPHHKTEATTRTMEMEMGLTVEESKWHGGGDDGNDVWLQQHSLGVCLPGMMGVLT